MNPKLKEKLMESLTAVLPITLIVLALSVVLVPMDVGTAVMFTVGAVLLVFGMGLFQLARKWRCRRWARASACRWSA